MRCGGWGARSCKGFSLARPRRLKSSLLWCDFWGFLSATAGWGLGFGLWSLCCRIGGLPLRWHPRFVSLLQASPFWILDFALASAIR